MEKLFIIPQFDNDIIAVVSNGKILELGEIENLSCSESVITSNGMIVSLCSRSNILMVFDISGSYIKEINVHSKNIIACKENTVYMFGRSKNEIEDDHWPFSLIDFGDKYIISKEIELPLKLKAEKSIDDILICGNEMLLVDNIVYPKYLFKYDISQPNEPIHIKTEELPNNGTYEHIIKGDMNNDWLVLFSSTFDNGASFQYISISGKSKGTLATHWPIGETVQRDFNSHMELSNLKFRDICLLENHLFILTRGGLAYINLNKPITNENIILIYTHLNDIIKIIKTPSNELVLIKKLEYELFEGWGLIDE